MISNLIATPATVLTLSARSHGMILASQSAAATKAMEDDDWTCHECRVRIPEMMEIDHTLGHNNPGKGLKPICQLCHNLKHPVWSASRGRIFPIYAPDILQSDLNRLAWTLIARRDEVEVDDVYDAIRRRRDQAASIIGCDNCEALFESSLLMIRKHDPKNVKRAFMEIDQFLRFWPSEVTEDSDTLPASARVSTWTLGGFRVAANTCSRILRENHSVDVDAVGEAGEDVLNTLRADKGSAD